MAREFSRTNQISKLVMRELAHIIQCEICDPRIGMVTVSYVDVASDLKYAKVFITRLDSFNLDQDINECLEYLSNAAGFLRHILAKRLKLRVIPELCFLYDTSLQHGFYMDSLIAQANFDITDD